MAILDAVCSGVLEPDAVQIRRVRDGQHFGSASVRRFIEEHQPSYFYCGHIHEAAGEIDQIGATLGMNVGKAGYFLDLDAG